MNKQEQQIVDEITQGIGLWLIFIWVIAFALWFMTAISGLALLCTLVISTHVLVIAGCFVCTAEIDRLRTRNAAAELNQKENK